MKQNNNEQIIKKKNKTIPIIICIFAFIIVAISVGFILYNTVAKPKKQLQAKLDMADKYLSELDYENAILAYEEVLAIDPNNTAAYRGIIDAYQKSGDYDTALVMAERAYEATGDEQFMITAEKVKRIIRAQNTPDTKTEEVKETEEEQPRDFSTLTQISVADMVWEFKVGDVGANENAVGMMYVTFNYTSSVPIGFQIAQFRVDPPYSTEEIIEAAQLYEDVWADVPVYINDGTTTNGFPVYEDDFGKNMNILLFARDESGKIVNYSQIGVRLDRDKYLP